MHKTCIIGEPVSQLQVWMILVPEERPYFLQEVAVAAHQPFSANWNNKSKSSSLQLFVILIINSPVEAGDLVGL